MLVEPPRVIYTTHMYFEINIVAVSFKKGYVHVNVHVIIVRISVNNRPAFVNRGYPETRGMLCF